MIEGFHVFGLFLRSFVVVNVHLFGGKMFLMCVFTGLGLLLSRVTNDNRNMAQKYLIPKQARNTRI
jgi:hypothetical protein